MDLAVHAVFMAEFFFRQSQILGIADLKQLNYNHGFQSVYVNLYFTLLFHLVYLLYYRDFVILSVYV